jgi:hypothetical protein
MIFFDERCGWADVDALAASGADAFGKRHIVSGHNYSVKAPAGLAECVYALDFGTHPDAPAAENTLVRVSYHGGGRKVFMIMFSFAGEVPVPNAHCVCQPLELAVAVAFANVTVLRVIIQQQFDDVSPGLAEFLGICMYLHAVEEGIRTGGDIVFHSFDFDDTNPARAFDGKLRMVA